MTAAALLRSYSKLSLERMAKQRWLETKGQNKEALINLLAPVLFDTDAIRRALAALSPGERRVLDEVRLLGGDAPTGLIKRCLEREGSVQLELPRGATPRSPTAQGCGLSCLGSKPWLRVWAPPAWCSRQCQGAMPRRSTWPAPVSACWETARPNVCRALGRSSDPEVELDTLGHQLDTAYESMVANLPTRLHGQPDPHPAPTDGAVRNRHS
jgi:hypothetical protein